MCVWWNIQEQNSFKGLYEGKHVIDVLYGWTFLMQGSLSSPKTHKKKESASEGKNLRCLEKKERKYMWEWTDNILSVATEKYT